MDNIGPVLITIVGGLLGLATVAVIVSQRAQTPQVFQSGGSALAAVISAAVSPVTGSGGSTGFGSILGLGAHG